MEVSHRFCGEPTEWPLNDGTYCPPTEEWAELQREGTRIRSAWWTMMEWAAERQGADQILERKKCLLPVAQSGLRDRAAHLLTLFMSSSPLGTDFG